MNALKHFFRKKETYLGIAAALAFQLIFFSIWLTAYDGVLDRTDQLKIAVINDDKEYGEMISQMLGDLSEFDVKEVSNLNKVDKEMDKREWNMIVHIPNHFTADLEQNGSTHIDYYINQSNPTLSKQMMESAATIMTNKINGHAYTEIQKQISEQVPKAVAQQAPDKELATQVAISVLEEIQKATEIEPVKMSLNKTNDVEGFAASMIPLLVVLASFVGAMIMSQHLQFAADKLKAQFGKWPLFFARQVINLSLSLLLSLLTLGLMVLFNIHIEGGLLTLWLFQTLLFFSFLSSSQVFVILFGNIGMVFNILAMATQLVSSGAIVPRELLSSFYKSIGSFLPATYGTNGYFSFIYGGGDIVSDATNLIVISLITLLITAGGVMFQLLTTKISKKEKMSA